MTRYMLAVAAAVAFVMTARAGGPPPVYVVVDEVVVEPSKGDPERIIIRGVFARLKEKGSEYAAPVEGSVHFSLPKDKAKEWEPELKAWQKAAGTGKVVPVGMCEDAGAFLTVTIRKADEKAKTADAVYTPGHVGATDETNGKQTWADMKPVQALQGFVKERKAKAEKGEKKAEKGKGEKK